MLLSCVKHNGLDGCTLPPPPPRDFPALRVGAGCELTSMSRGPMPMHSQQPHGVVQNWSTLQCNKQNTEQCGYDHAHVTRGRMRAQFPLPHGPVIFATVMGARKSTACHVGPTGHRRCPGEGGLHCEPQEPLDGVCQECAECAAVSSEGASQARSLFRLGGEGSLGALRCPARGSRIPCLVCRVNSGAIGLRLSEWRGSFMSNCWVGMMLYSTLGSYAWVGARILD